MFCNFCENFENSKWPPFLARQKLFENWEKYSAEISCGSKILSKLLYLARFLRYKHFCVLQFLRKFRKFKMAAILGERKIEVNSKFLLSFMEYLYQSNLSSSHISNYMAALRSFYILNALDTTPFRDERIPLFLKSIKIQAPFSPTMKTSIDITLLESIVQQCSVFPHTEVSVSVLTFLLFIPPPFKYTPTHYQDIRPF